MNDENFVKLASLSQFDSASQFIRGFFIGRTDCEIVGMKFDIPIFCQGKICGSICLRVSSLNNVFIHAYGGYKRSKYTLIFWSTYTALLKLTCFLTPCAVLI